MQNINNSKLDKILGRCSLCGSTDISKQFSMLCKDCYKEANNRYKKYENIKCN